MKYPIFEIFKAPIFTADEEKTRRARILTVLQLNMGATILILGTLGVMFLFA